MHFILAVFPIYFSSLSRGSPFDHSLDSVDVWGGMLRASYMLPEESPGHNMKRRVALLQMNPESHIFQKEESRKPAVFSRSLM